MLDHCSISHRGGTVLWSRSFTPDAAKLAASGHSPVNSLVRDALIEGKTTESKYEKDGYAVQWVFFNELELIFVVVYQRILHLTYVEDLLNAMKTLFVKMFEPFLVTFVASLHVLSKATSPTPRSWNFIATFAEWNPVFNKLLRGLEDRASLDRRSKLRSVPMHKTHSQSSMDENSTEPAMIGDDVQDGQDIALNVSILKNRIKAGGPGRRKGPGRSLANGHGSASGTESDTPAKKKASKTMRKWGDQAPSESEMAALDFSANKDLAPDSSALVESLVDKRSLGTRKNDGSYEIQDWDFSGSDGTLQWAIAGGDSATDGSAKPMGTIGSMFARLTGGKVLSKEDLEPVLSAMKEHLMKKNVAKEIAEKVCDGVGKTLIGKRIGGFQTIKTAVRDALSISITQVLTPKTSTDILQSVRTKISSPLPSTAKRSPYSIAFVGVNGVGKSTNLSKVCFWLLQNGFRVLIAACDTFRSGAVEQLRVHVRNLSMLAVNNPELKQGSVELYEKGYGKDAAGIAKEAIAYAKENEFDVVLIDTAGRMQDNEPLMKALAKLISTNDPDKIIFVGEALVGNEAVDQLTKFDRALRDFGSAHTGGTTRGRGIDGMLITKWDTVDDKVGAALSMTFVTGQPIYFVGCGQTYTDLRQLTVRNVVDALLGA